MKKAPIYFFFLITFLSLRIQAQCVNGDFEATAPGAYTSSNAVNGWVISSQTANCAPSNIWTAGSPEFSIVSTPVVVPYIGTIPNSPLGGSKVAQLNNFTANAMVTRLTQSFVPTTNYNYFQFAYAGIWQGGPHNCCEQAGFKVRLRDQSGNEVTCPSFSLAGAGCQYVPNYTLTSGTMWTGWQIKYIDLSPYVGQQIAIEITVNDCVYSDHYGSVFFDAGCPFSQPPIACFCPVPIPFNPVISFCPNTSTATIESTHGYPEYQWEGPAGYPISPSQASLSAITVTNALAGNVYTVHMINGPNFCINTHTVVLATTTVSVAAFGSYPSCAAGANGSGTIIGTGSSAGYNYTWTSSTGSVVSTSSVASGLSSGIYSVHISVPGQPGCGNVSTTVQIAQNTQSLIALAKVYCGNEAYLDPGGGSNFKWYNGSTTIPAGQGGTAPSYTVTAPVNYSVYHLSYTSPFGCKDSIKYVLLSTVPGTLTVPNLLACPNSTNTAVTITLIPAAGALQGQNYFYISSTGTTALYSASLSPTSSYTFNASSLSGGGTYSIEAFDGSCKYSKSFSVTPVTADYTVSVSPSATLCSGQGGAASVSFSNGALLGQHTYTWTGTPTIFGSGTSNAILSPPAVSPGNMAVVVYTVVVTPTIAPCPVTKTISLTIANLLTPSVSPIPTLCTNAGTFAVTANPSWGTFINHPALSAGGVLQPSLALPGANTFVYQINIGSCKASTSGTFFAVTSPSLLVSNTSLSVCAGENATLTATGAASYSLNNIPSGPAITVSPFVTTTYTITGASAQGCNDSKTVSIQAAPLPTLSISGASICAGENTTITASGAASYSFNNSPSGSLIAVNPPITSTYTITGASAEGCSDSKMVTVQVDPCTGLNDLTASAQLRIYPNPTNGQLFVEAQLDTEIIVTDAFGKVILKKQLPIGKDQIDLGGCASGIYFLEARYHEQTKIIKLVKNN